MSGGVFSKLMSVWEAYEGYTLNATDEFQKGGIEASVQKGIDRLYEKGKITDDSLRNAGEQEALYRTFQDKTVLSDAAIGVRLALNKAHIGDIGAGDIMLPFSQVPSNLGARAICPEGRVYSGAAGKSRAGRRPRADRLRHDRHCGGRRAARLVESHR